VERAYDIMGAAEGAPAAALLEYLAAKQRAGRVRILGEPSWDPRRRVPTLSLVHRELSSAAVCAALARETIGSRRSLPPPPPPSAPPPLAAAAAAADNSAGDYGNAAETNRKGVSSSHEVEVRFSSSSSSNNRSSSNGFGDACDNNNDDAEEYGREEGRRPRIVCRHGSFLAPRLLAALGVPDPYGGDGALRFSLVHYNTVSDVRNLIIALEDIGF
jgi:hypothetical protein